ncbi:MAG TPA: lysozyme inhibitor LprI family protein [Polyangia bacterium]|nr:lysozyme inhibitor LprI family protein [Polyangia bacterium]
MPLRGVWDVEHVALDKKDTIHHTYQPDDPELMAASLIIGTPDVRFSIGHLECSQTNWQARVTTWRDLFAKAFVRSNSASQSKFPTPDDFGIAVGPEKATAYSLCPDSRSRFPKNSWAALKEADVLLLRYDEQLLFVLRRRSENAEPKPSFDCGKAVQAAEKAICKDFELAAMDRALDLARRQLLEALPEKKDSLGKTQTQWLKERDACGNDPKCIGQSIRRRIETLVWERRNG